MQLAWRSRFAQLEGDDTAHEQACSDAEDDLAIIARAQTDPRAFAPLYQRYAPKVYVYCRRRLIDAELAADATSLIFIRALGALPSFRVNTGRPGSTVRSWLFTIAHNVVVDHHRRSRSHLRLDDDATARWLTTTPHLTDKGATPEAVFAHAESTERVHAILAILPDRQRQVVELRLAGLSGLEIAETLGMTHAAVKSTQFRAYSALRDVVNAARSEIDHA